MRPETVEEEKKVLVLVQLLIFLAGRLFQY